MVVGNRDAYFSPERAHGGCVGIHVDRVDGGVGRDRDFGRAGFVGSEPGPGLRECGEMPWTHESDWPGHPLLFCRQRGALARAAHGTAEQRCHGCSARIPARTPETLPGRGGGRRPVDPSRRVHLPGMGTKGQNPEVPRVCGEFSGPDARIPEPASMGRTGG